MINFNHVNSTKKKASLNNISKVSPFHQIMLHLPEGNKLINDI